MLISYFIIDLYNQIYHIILIQIAEFQDHLFKHFLHGYLFFDMRISETLGIVTISLPIQ
ncbi:unnamed protein product [Hymenolepis diminuta]|uniref:Uncharacterized protein n=1 Tax=Hymenolepis diminuta TaxID=6216 RepID=A0A564Y8C4_HYMDI|nr:unnamed protein product [Hymenolepis diminuta]